MSPAVHQFVSIDLPPMLTALFTGLACALLGNFLVLRRLSLMGDAISHAVLPGLVISFLVTGSRSPLPMFLGAAAAGVMTVVMVELVRRLGRLESGAAMGVVFSVLFALGVLLLEQAAARQVDLDPDCVLHGMLEAIFWFPPGDWRGFLSFATLAELPRQVFTSAGVALASIALVSVLFKELRLAAFDPGHASALGFHAGALHYVLMVCIAASTVAAFEAVGSILVIAMLIGPPAAARLLTDRLSTQVLLSALLAAATTIAGYVAGAFLPGWLGYGFSLSTTGMMAVMIGAALAISALGSPAHGVIAKALRRARLAADIAREDLLGALYRVEERRATPAQLASVANRRAVRGALRRGDVSVHAGRIALTEQGRRAAVGIIRSHRLWESYLVGEAGLKPDHVHDAAMRLEHLAERPLNEQLSSARPESGIDPQGKPIPE